ncbi:two-component regulator propeller domain-containing protein [Algoriphagus zhangzhouensis]|uniref:histidine kinase n=1 Tax=Algoriphagus zhangzhouensis TaxID=1073327 RepID=A0A1M7ZAF8_9BACT|nr:two-component regulator propeller domain-containing protein [Algoriphagus zhangzhouensis]TDY47316.1 two component regulator with propeller domain [Algoriphagus zhangzhouensis]SHO61666.1 Two component regulator propeller [Algoriphagus zhangzhouensis]
MRSLITFSFVFLFGLVACNQEEKTSNQNPIGNWSPPEKIVVSELPAEKQPQIIQMGAPEVKRVGGNRGGNILPPIKKDLLTLQEYDGSMALNALGQPYLLGDGGIAQFKKITSDEGLPMDGIYCAMVDSRGHIWFGTNGGGLSRYDGVDFTNYTGNQGLGSPSIRSINEDSKGNIWIGTADKVVSKFDGRTFKNFYGDQISNEVVYSIYEDSKGILWFGTDGEGLVKYDGNEFEKITTEDGLAHNSVISIFEDKDGYLWVGTSGGGVSKYNGESFENFDTSNGLAGNRVRSIFQDSKGIIWFGTLGTGVSKYDGQNFQTIGIDDGLAGMVVRSINEDHENNVWFATEYGVTKWTGKDFISYTTEQGLVGNNVYDLTIDDFGKIWFSTDGSGVSRLDGMSFTNFTAQQGLSGNIVLSIMEDSTGDLWFGTVDGGLSKFDGKSFVSYTQSQGLAGEIAYCILEDSSGKIWIGAAGDGISIFDSNTFTNYSSDQGLPTNEIYSLVESRDGKIWIGTDAGILINDNGVYTYYSEENGLSSNNIVSITEDSDGIIWIGSLGGGLTRFDGKTFLHFTIDQGLADSSVLRIKEDSNGNLWVGTANGISFLTEENRKNIISWKYNGETPLFQTFNSQDGLPDDTILQIVELGNGQMAIGTNEGISTFYFYQDSSKNIQELETYHSDTGYPVKDLTDGQDGMFLDSKGILWAGTGSVKTGLARLDLSKVSKNTSKPTPLIKQVRINEEIIPWYTLAPESSEDAFEKVTDQLITLERRLDENEELELKEKFKGISFDNIQPFFPIPLGLTLPYQHNHLNIEYGTNELARPFLIEYQYILEGYDTDWSPVLKRTSATFGNIHEGDYTFKIRARYTGTSTEEASEWTEPIEFSFTVLPPWYRSWWAYLVYGVLILWLLYPINLYLKNRLLKAEREKAKERELEHAKQIEKAYTDLESAHENLKSTQSQLIQAEKMASLGELTAGIAHEIQNPLNFVKNFSEVSHELVDEMNEEIQAGDFEEAKLLAKDIQDNLDRISTHSMRADAIVKAMLQHSKATVGTKELVDINAICDESIRLSYHGVRAKEKDFSVEYKTDLEPNLPQVEVIRQELVRALINMCNNAFFAVNERVHQLGNTDFKPVVSISTKKTLGGIEIELADNGVGIKKDVIEKIFQPFFTTKPTGQGTGLGLSLSYDIIKSYSGDIRVKSSTEENPGTIFTIFLPINSSS